MAEFSDRLTAEEELAAGYLRAQERYLARREELGTAEEIRDVSAGGMPVRVKCLHALAGQTLAEGPGINPVADEVLAGLGADDQQLVDRKSTRLNSSHVAISYAVFCLKKKKKSRNSVRDTPN